MTVEDLAEKIVRRFVDEASKEAMRSMDPEYLAKVKMRQEILNSRPYMDCLKEIIVEEIHLANQA